MNPIKNYIHGRDYKHTFYYNGDSKDFTTPGYGQNTSMFWKPDGSVFYAVLHNVDAIRQFNCSVPWDITTAVNNGLSAVIPDTSPQAFYITEDGLQLFVIGLVNKTIFKYTLTYPWDITSWSLTQQVTDTANFNSSSIQFSPDGLNMYLNRKQYALSTPWDLSTLTLTYSATSFVFGFFITNNGKYLYTYNYSGFFKYELSTPWMLNSLVQREFHKLDPITPLGNNVHCYVRADGLKLFIGFYNTPSKVHQYYMEEPFTLNSIEVRDKHNTIIGGMGANIYFNSTVKLATRLGINWSRIKNFELKGNDIYCTITGGNYQAPNLVFCGTEITSFTDKNGLCTTSAGNMFLNCTSLVSIYMPALTTTIYRFASGCTSLSTVYAPLISSIVPEMFTNCSALTTISLGTSTTVGTCAFQNCTSLTSVTSTGSVTTINSYAFNNTPALSTVNFPSLTGTIGTQAFRQSGITSFNTYNATISGTQAFAECNNLTTFTGNSLTDISIYGFHQCVNLTIVSLPELTTCGYWSFYNTKITNLELPKLTTAIANDVFSTMIYLDRLYIPSCTTLGSNAASNNMFMQLKTGCQIYANTYLQTNNDGAPDGDLAFAISSRGAIVNYL